MKRVFIIKLQGKQHAKGCGRLVFMLLCFIVALVVLMIYSSKYYIALLTPVFYLILRLKNISAEKDFLADAVCTVYTHDFGVLLSIDSAQSKLSENHNVLYSNTNNFKVSERKVTISYTDNTKRQAHDRLIEFHILPDDVEFWAELSDEFSQ